MKIDTYSDKKLVKEYLKQLKDEKEHPEKYDEPGDMPSYYLWEEIVGRNLEIPPDKPKVAFVSADWKDTDGLISGFKAAIEKVFKGKVYLIPSFKGSDSYGFIISDKPLDRKQIKELDGDGEN